MTPIQAAVEPLRQETIQRAAEFARKHAERVLEALRTAGMDLDVYAPAPRGTMDRATYRQAQALRDVAQRLTSPAKATRLRGEPNLRLECPANVERFVDEARLDASSEYDAFIAKLEAKVGAHSAATLDGSHVWGYSILTVTTPAGVQRWQTQQIVNVSKLGKVFNQWPTRLVK